MRKIFSSESELSAFAESLGRDLLARLSLEKSSEKTSTPIVLELIGDVGAGKTTFTRALAKGLGVKSPVTSPSFSISNRYSFPLSRTKTERMFSADSISRRPNSGKQSFAEGGDAEISLLPEETSENLGTLIHYDFYRLDDPGIMSAELAEALTEKNTVIVLEWSDSVKNLLPKTRTTVTFTILSETERELNIK